MKKALKRIENAVFYYENGEKIEGSHSGLSGNVSGLSGNVSGVWGNVSGLRGDIDACGLTETERKRD